jgi:hypothetical protein
MWWSYPSPREPPYRDPSTCHPSVSSYASPSHLVCSNTSYRQYGEPPLTWSWSLVIRSLSSGSGPGSRRPSRANSLIQDKEAMEEHTTGLLDAEASLSPGKDHDLA